MVLSLHERRVIADLERSLTREEPELSKTLADFGQPRSEALRAAPPVEAPPEDRTAVRARRVTSWSSALALMLLFVSLALSAAGLLLGASVTALLGVVCWLVYRCQRHRRRASREDSSPARPPAP